MKKLLTFLALGSTTLAFGLCPCGCPKKNKPNDYLAVATTTPNRDTAYQPSYRSATPQTRQQQATDAASQRQHQGSDALNARQQQEKANLKDGKPLASNPNYKNGNGNSLIAKQIQEDLSTKGLHVVYLNVGEDVITLDGAVDTNEKKNAILEQVKTSAGQREVHNNISVQSPTRLSNADIMLERSEKKFSKDTAATKEDRILNARIRDKISGGWLAPLNEALIIKSSNGAVIITGEVSQPEDMDSIAYILKNVEGVKSIDNQATIKQRH